jgi:hypothetical protein
MKAVTARKLTKAEIERIDRAALRAARLAPLPSVELLVARVNERLGKLDDAGDLAAYFHVSRDGEVEVRKPELVEFARRLAVL